MAARGDAQDIEARRASREGRVRRRRVVAREAVVPPQGAVQGGRPDRGALRRDHQAAVARDGRADRPRASGPASDDRALGLELPVLRRGAGARRQRIVQSRRQPAHVHDARSGRRVRVDHAVERAVHAVDVEDGAVPRVRQQRRAQAVGTVAAVDAQCCARSSRKPACRRASTTWCSATAPKPACRSSNTRTSSACRSPARSPTARDIAGARREVAEAHVVRTRRQVGQHHLRGREPATRGAGRGDVDLHEFGPGVRRRLAHPRAAADLSAVPRRVREGRGGPGRRAIRSIARRASARSCTSASTIA